MKNPVKIGVYVHKGGCGKSSAIINIAYNLQKLGFSVCCVDCDSQLNSFSFFQAREFPNISNSTWLTYQNALKSDLQMNFDYVLFDLPPAMSDEVKEVIRHCDAVFVPIILGNFEVAGLSDVTAEIGKQGAKLGGVFVSMFSPQNNDTEMLEELRGILKNRLMNTVIPFSKTVRESQKAELAVEELFIKNNVPPNPQSWKIVRAYESLTNEIIERSNFNVNV